MKRETFSTFVPFSGFYCSIHEDIIDQAEEQLFCDTNGDPFQNLLDIFYDHVNYQAVRKEYAKLYVDVLAEVTNLKSLAFEEVTSPREYNFQTDRIFASLSRDDLAKILRVVKGKKLDKKIKEMYSSRSGFISFYPNRIAEWPRIDDWDHNHVGAVLSAYIESEYDQAEGEIVEGIYSDGSVSGYLYDAADFTGKAAADLASVKCQLEEESLADLYRQLRQNAVCGGQLPV